MKPWAEKFYKSKAWQDCRAGFMRSKSFMCERCAARGEITPAKIAHHKTPLTRGNINDVSITLSWNNLEAVCEACHAAAHPKDTRTKTTTVIKRKERYSFSHDGKLLPPLF